MRSTALRPPEVLLIEPSIIADARGAFCETWNASSFAKAGLDATFVQQNVSVSRRFVLRGLHYQCPEPQGKLIRVLAGEIFDVVVDLRRSSADFGRGFSLHLTGADYRSLWVPPGFAHGFLSLTENTQVQYSVTRYWAPTAEHTLAWNDADLAIEWPLPAGTEPILSEKDSRGSSLSVAETFP